MRFASVLLILLCASLAEAADPVVSNVTAMPLSDGQVRVRYDLADADTYSLYVTLEVSSDGGATYATRPAASTMSGAVGSGVSRGFGKTITWTSCKTFPGATGGNYKVRVTASDSYSGGWGGGGTPGDMVYIPAGSFLMGNNGSEPYTDSDELPQHSVYLSGYWIGMYEVTRGEYRRFMEAGGYGNPAYWSSAGWSWKVLNGRTEPAYWAAAQDRGNGTFTQTDSHPVVGVTYYEAEAYCAWAGGHLPTEAQWEKAARWTGSYPNVYPWGNVWDAEKCNNYNDHSSAGGGYQRYQTAPVGSYPSGASPYGLQDMAGNVWEWCRDWYGSSYYSVSPTTDPQGPSSGSYRVLRGGSWYYLVYDYYDYGGRCAKRFYYLPGNYWDDFGFRIAR